MIKALLFDFDGTLANSSEGIFYTANYTVKQLGYEECTDLARLSKFVGPPLRDCFRIVFDLPEDKIEDAVEIYRKEYDREGMFKCYLYDGIEEVLVKAKSLGIKTAVCTLKGEELATRMTKNLTDKGLLDIVCGTNLEGTLSKTDNINRALAKLGINNEEALMIGDTRNDEGGAKNCNVPFCAALWGFGFKDGKEIDAKYIFTNPRELLNLI